MKKRRYPVALLIIDMFNTLDFPEWRGLHKDARPAAKRIARLKARAKGEGIPVLYVNDNFGRWHSNAHKVFDVCRESRGAELSADLEPEEDDYFVLKPKHSAFYSTTLDLLLTQLGTETLIVTGIAGNLCVLFTANDAHMRDYEVFVPSDCTASNTPRDNKVALDQLERVLKISTKPSTRLDLARIKAKASRRK